MPQNLVTKKNDFCIKMSELAREVLLLAQKWGELHLYYQNNGFNQGAANQFVDADLTGQNAHLTPQIIEDVDFLIAGLDAALTAGARSSLRKALSSEIF